MRLHATANNVANLPVWHNILIRQTLEPAQHAHLLTQIPRAIKIPKVSVDRRFAFCAHLLILHIPTSAATAKEVRGSLMGIEQVLVVHNHCRDGRRPRGYPRNNIAVIAIVILMMKQGTEPCLQRLPPLMTLRNLLASRLDLLAVLRKAFRRNVDVGRFSRERI